MTDTSAAGPRLADALREAELDPDAAVLLPAPTADSPPPPPGPWVVLPFGDGFVVGAMSRGRFAQYDQVETFERAAMLVIRLLQESAARRTVPDPARLGERGRATSQAIRSRTAERGGAAGPAAVDAGDVLDVVGPETAHHLYALGTAFDARSQPPTDAHGPYHRYEVLAELPDASEGVAAPWFGQPGGGAMVVLPRPIRWYVDQRLLVELVDPDPA